MTGSNHNKTLVLTATIGGNRPFSEFTVDSQRKYADKIGAEFIHVEEFEVGDEYNDIKIGRGGNKGYLVKCLVIQKYFKEYGRILWLDDTCLVSSNTPDLFMLTPPEMFGAHNEGMLDWVAAQTQTINLLANGKLPINTLTKQGYFNSGVMVLTKEFHEILFRKETIIKFGKAGYWDNGYPDQTYLNLAVSLYKKGFYALPEHFNKMVLVPENIYDGCTHYHNYTGRELAVAKEVTKFHWITDKTTEIGHLHHAYIYHITSFYKPENRTNIIKRLYDLKVRK